MRRCTGIELGPDSCAMVAAGPGDPGANVSAFHVIGAAAWPSHDAAVTSTLQSARREMGFPRRAAVVLWGLPDTALPDDPSTLASVRPVTDAGFRVESVLSPPQALALVAASRPRPVPGAATAWVALNTHGVAIAIVRDDALLFARTFDWKYRGDATNPRAQMLERYTLVSHVAPELQRGIAQVKTAHAAEVETVVTCGDLPDLRSLTMPLIEELGLEVETLDSTDGMQATGRAAGDRFAELASSLRLATAVAVNAVVTSRSALPVWLRTAAAVVAMAAAGWAVLAFWPRATEDPRRAPEMASVGAPSAPRASVQTPAATIPAAPPVTQAPAALDIPAPVAQRPSDTSAAQQPAATSGVRPPAPASSSRSDPPAVVAAATLPSRPPSARTPARPAPVALSDPLPRVDSILIDHNRRLAVVEGATVRVGDSIGARVIAEIQQEAIILREPSGLQVRVRLRR